MLAECWHGYLSFPPIPSLWETYLSRYRLSDNSPPPSPPLVYRNFIADLPVFSFPSGRLPAQGAGPDFFYGSHLTHLPTPSPLLCHFPDAWRLRTHCPRSHVIPGFTRQGIPFSSFRASLREENLPDLFTTPSTPLPGYGAVCL